ncbi:MAG: hypothetical protein ABI203_03335 [Mucilaginibacter sp.]
MIREVIIPDKNKISVSVPDDYIGKAIEVIAFALDESSMNVKTPTPTFNALKIDTVNFRFNRDEANER